MVEKLPSASMETHETEVHFFSVGCDNVRGHWNIDDNKKFWGRIQSSYNKTNIKRFTQLHFYSNLQQNRVLFASPRLAEKLYLFCFLTPYSEKHPEFGAYFSN